MAGYFGNGYFLKVVQRGAAPFGKPRARPAQLPSVFEETVTTGAGQPSEVSAQTSVDSGQTFAAQKESPAHSVTTFPQPLNDDFLVEPRGFDTDVTASLEAHDTTVPAVTKSSVPETSGQTSSPAAQTNDPLDTQEGPIEPSVDTNSYQSFTPAGNVRESRSGSRVFELRMPEGFYPGATDQTSRVEHARPLAQPPLVATTSESDPVEVNTQEQSHVESTIIPKQTVELPELSIESSQPGPTSSRPGLELRQPGPTTESHETKQAAAVAQEIVTQVMPPSPLLPAEVFESSAPTPRAEQPAEYQPFRPPSITPAPIVLPARLQINRLDIQVINQAPAPPPLPPAQGPPDVSQLLEKKHVGRVELLL